MIYRILRFAALLLVAWCVMAITHEAGHVVGGWLGGGTLRAADLRPWRLPYSLFQPDPRPLVTLWSGPLFGVIAPLLVALLVRRAWMWFIADFCLLANGAYLVTAWFADDPLLDTPRLLSAGAPPLSIALYCILTIGVGYVRFRRDCVQVLSPREPKVRHGTA